MTNDDLANDRTFLAWIRTGIALFGLGFVVAKVALIVDPAGDTGSDANLYSAVGVLIVLCGGAAIQVGYRQHRAVAKAVHPDDQAVTGSTWVSAFAAMAAVGAVVLSTLIIATT